MTSILREVCRERLNQEWAQADKSLDNYKNVMSKESKLIDEGEIRKTFWIRQQIKFLHSHSRNRLYFIFIMLFT